MGASEDRAVLREYERVAAASAVKEIMIPGYGIWTREALRSLVEREQFREIERQMVAENERVSRSVPPRPQERRDHQSEEELRLHLREHS